MTKSEMTIKNVAWNQLGIIPNVFRKLGIQLEQSGDDIYIPAQEHYKIQKFIDGSILYRFRCTLARIYARFIINCLSCSNSGKRNSAYSPKNV
jgi:hypothetical protein